LFICNLILLQVNEELLSQFDVVVCVDQTVKTLLSVAKVTRAKGIKLIAANNMGLFAVAFNDFGDNFEVTDTNGEQPISVMVSDIDPTEGVVTTQDESR